MYLKTEQLIEELVMNQKIPGVSYSFITGTSCVEKNIGYKQLVPQQVPLEKETLYDMASLTKVICTTTIILKLMESGQLDLDLPLHSHLPEFLDGKVTIRELLTHTSGIEGYIPNRDSLNKEELKAAILGLTSGEERGHCVKYTDTGTILLGFLIEKIYEQPVHQIFREEVLLPLEMVSSGFSEVNMEKTAPTEKTVSRGVIQGEVHDPKAFVLGENCGSAGLFSNISDTNQFIQMIFQKGKLHGKPFLTEETILNLLKDQTLGANKARSLGWDLLEYDNRHLLYHTGYTGTFIILDVLEEEAFVFLSNRVHPVDNREDYIELRDKLVNVYLKERQEIEKML